MTLTFYRGERRFNKSNMTKQYSQVIDELTEVMNTKRGKNTAEKFYNSVKSLKVDFGKEISTKFLRNLLNNSYDARSKTKRISYLLRASGLKTKRTLRYYRTETNKQRQVDVVEYGHTRGHLYTDFPRHLFNEDMTLKEDVGIQRDKSTGEKRTISGNEILNLRNDINKGGRVYIKDIRVQNVGVFFIEHKAEVLYIISI